MNPFDPNLADSLDGLGPKKRGGKHDATLDQYKTNLERAFKNGASLRTVAEQLNKHLKPKLGVHTLVNFCDRNRIERPKKKTAKPGAPRKPKKPAADEFPFDDDSK